MSWKRRWIGSGLAVLAIGVVAMPAQAYVRPAINHQVDAVPGRPITGDSWYSSVSANGRYVAFDTFMGLDPLDVNATADVYVRDTWTGRVTLASIGLGGGPAEGVVPADQTCARAMNSQWGWGNNVIESAPLSWDPAISGNGRYVAYTSYAKNLVPGTTNAPNPDVYVFDMRTHTNRRVSVASNGDQGATSLLDNANTNVCPASFSPSIDGSGRTVSFTSGASNFAAHDDNRTNDVFIHRGHRTERVSVPLTQASAPPVPLDPNDPVGCVAIVISLLPCGPSGDSSLSEDGRFVAFDSSAGNLVRGDTNNARDVFVRDLAKHRTERVSTDSAGRQVGDHENYYSSITSQDGNAGTLQRGIPVEHAISADGRYVLFWSNSPDLIPNEDYRGSCDECIYFNDFFVKDRATGRIQRVTVNSWGREQGRLWGVQTASISADGRFVAYENYPSLEFHDPPAGARPGTGIVVYDRLTGTMEEENRASNGSWGKGCVGSAPASDGPYSGGWAPDLSGDGRYLTMATCDSNMQDRPDPQGVRYHVIDRDRGLSLGVGDLGVSVRGAPAFAASGVVSSADAIGDVTTPGQEAADLTGATLAARPSSRDLFVRIAVGDMPTFDLASPALVYGMDFTTGSVRYEVRAAKVGPDAAFGLFRLDDLGVWTKVADLQGGYGTTGEEVVFAVPVRDIGLKNGGFIRRADVFSAIGTFLTGRTAVLDRALLSP